MELWQISAVGLGRLVSEGWASSREVTRAHLERIAAVDPSVNAVVEVLAEGALADADAADRAVRAGARRAALRGAPFTVRRNTDLAGSATAGGIPAQTRRPAGTAQPIDQLRRAAAIAIGLTNTHDEVFRWNTDTAGSQATVNPWNANVTAGACGDAAAVATGMTPLALGGDDGGTLRLAAQACGVAALRPTRGRVAANSPTIPDERALALRLFTGAGFTARRVEDLTAALHATAGGDPSDPQSLDIPLGGPAWPRRVAITVNPGGLGVDADVARGVRRAADALADVGYQVDETEAPNIEQAASTWATLVTTEAHLNPGFWYHRMGPRAQAFIDDLAEAAPIRDHDRYTQARAQRHAQLRTWAQFQQRYPIILGPVSTAQPVAAGDDLIDTTVTTELRQAARLVAAFTMLDLPVVVTPVAITQGLPQAAQLAAPRWREDIALAAAHDIEQRLGIPTPIDPTRWRHNTPATGPSLDLQPTG